MSDDSLDFDWPLHPDDAAESRSLLKEILARIEKFDTDYEPRYTLVLAALSFAATGGYPAGFAIDPAEPDWPVAFIELPTGQVSWHMPAHKPGYDGHTTEEKYARIKAYIGGEQA